MKYHISKIEEYLKVQYNASLRIDQKVTSRSGTNIYRRIWDEINNKSWILIIANFYPSYKLKILNKLVAKAIPRSIIKVPLFNNKITELIWRYKAIATYNTS